MKKRKGMLFAAVAAMCVFAACGGEDSPAKEGGEISGSSNAVSGVSDDVGKAPSAGNGASAAAGNGASAAAGNGTSAADKTAGSSVTLTRNIRDALGYTTTGRGVWGIAPDGQLHLIQRADKLDAAGDWSNIVKISASGRYFIGLKADGSAVGFDLQTGKARDDISAWSEVVDIQAGGYSDSRTYLYYAGLKADGTILSYGLDSTSTKDGRMVRVPVDKEQWINLTAIAGSHEHLVGLRADGSVVAAGNNEIGQCDVSEWSDVVKIYAADDATVGLKSDGTVVATGKNGNLAPRVADWTGVVDICIRGKNDITALKADGTVLKENGDVLFYASEAGVRYMIAHENGIAVLRADGTVVLSETYSKNGARPEEVAGWTDIAEIYPIEMGILALKNDGSVLASGIDNQEEITATIRSWKLLEAGN